MGNTICLAQWNVSPSENGKGSLVEINQLFTTPLLEGMTEVCQHLVSWVAEHQNV